MPPVSSGRLRSGEIKMEKKLIIAIVASIAVILIFQFVAPTPRRTLAPVQAPAREAGAPATALPWTAEGLPARSAEEPASLKEEATVVETEKYILTFTNIGGSLKDVKLKEYPDSKTGFPLQLVKDSEADRAIFSMASNTLARALDKQRFTLTKQQSDRIAYTYSVPGKLSIIKEYYFYKSFDYIELRILIQNLGNDIIDKNYDILGGSNFQMLHPVMGRRFLEVDSMIDGKMRKDTKVKNGSAFIPGIVSWTGLKERYFCIILKPQQESEGIILKQFSKSSLASGIRSKRSPIYPGQAAEDSYLLYIGPNDSARLSSLGLGLEKIINYGIFGGISKILLKTLRAFHKVVRNWGVAIIILTCLINLVLFPLTRKSFLSMRKIQEVQPHMEKLKKIHKDNPQKLNKELAELYKQYNINPLGGCLPMFLQIPVFIALYQGLLRSIELKGANFLWIKDLSRPDVVPLPFTLPVIGNELHILPLLMIGAMFFQQKTSAMRSSTSSPEQQQQQKIMMFFFPLFFGFLFYNFPSGLVLYWLTNTVLMVIEHSAMGKAHQK